MALTEIERNLLIKARERIKERNNGVICFALDNSVANRGEREAAVRLKEYIANQLYPYPILDAWQVNHGFGHRTHEQNRKDRINWINWMIGELE